MEKLHHSLCLRENFLSRETFQDVLLSCHFAVLLIMNFSDDYPHLECCLDRTGSDCCEVFFSLNGSWVKNHHAYTILDMIRNHSAMTRLAEIRANNKRLVFRKAHSKQDNIWDKQYQHDERNQTCNLKDYPDRNQAISAWNRGIAKAREMAQRVGIGGGIDIMANDDDDDDDNDDDDNHPNDNGSNDEESNSSDEDKAEENDSDEDDWFKKPFKGYSYKQLFADLITEAEIEDNEVEQREQSESCTNTENTTVDTLEDTIEDDDDYNGLIFSESQHIFTNELESPCNENGSNDGNIDKGKFQSDIYIPSLKARKYKSSVV